MTEQITRDRSVQKTIELARHRASEFVAKYHQRLEPTNSFIQQGWSVDSMCISGTLSLEELQVCKSFYADEMIHYVKHLLFESPYAGRAIEEYLGWKVVRVPAGTYDSVLIDLFEVWRSGESK